MRAQVDKSGCISCGLCVNMCPEVFKFDNDDVAEVFVDLVPASKEDEVKDAADGCPVGVISIT